MATAKSVLKNQLKEDSLNERAIKATGRALFAERSKPKRMIPSINCIDLTKASYFNLGQAMQQ